MSRNELVKREAEITEYGWKPFERPLDKYLKFGVINLDKPRGPTSHQVVAWVKRITGVRKAGHSGTLDPMVTGVLPIGLEDATKAMHYAITTGKEYVGVMRLHGDVRDSELRRIIALFQGRIYQRPPQRSSVRRRLRTRVIYSFEIIEREGRNVLFRVSCEAGTYVRKLIHDVGEVLGVGAHMAELRRTRVGVFDEDMNLVDLYDLLNAFETWKESGDEKLIRRVVMPVEILFKDFPYIIVTDEAASSIAYGAQLASPGVVRLSDDIKPGTRVAIFTQKGEIVAVGKAQMSSEQILESKRGIVATIERVFLPRDVYPKLWKRKQ